MLNEGAMKISLKTPEQKYRGGSKARRVITGEGRLPGGLSLDLQATRKHNTLAHDVQKSWDNSTVVVWGTRAKWAQR